jgi:hypothetical protein
MHKKVGAGSREATGEKEERGNGGKGRKRTLRHLCDLESFMRDLQLTLKR